MSLHRSSLATLSQAIYSYLKSNDIDADDMFRRAGLDPTRIHDAEARYGAHESIRLWRIAIQETRHPCLAYEIVYHIEPWMLHAVGHAWISSPTLLAALQRLERYHRMLSADVVIKMEQLQGAWQLIANVLDPMEHPARDAVLAFALHMSRHSFGEDLVPLQVQLARLEPMDATPIDSFFRCKVEYGFPENSMVFNSADLNRRLRGANTSVVQAMDEVIATYLDRFDSADVVTRVRKVVTGYLVHGEPTKEIIAAELNLAPRTLQRRLDEQGSSVKQIVDALRHQMSVEYLDQDHLSIKEIAFSLGFNDPSNFSRAFRRWEGRTPREHRKLKGK